MRKSQEELRSGDNADDFTSVTSVNVCAVERDVPSDLSLCSPAKRNGVCSSLLWFRHCALEIRCFQKDNKCLAFRCSELQQTSGSRRRIVNGTVPIRPSVGSLRYPQCRSIMPAFVPA
jgi:hypothetical protein